MHKLMTYYGMVTAIKCNTYVLTVRDFSDEAVSGVLQQDHTWLVSPCFGSIPESSHPINNHRDNSQTRSQVCKAFCLFAGQPESSPEYIF